MKNSAVNIEEISHHNFSNSLEASESIESLLENDDILYIKGSRGMKMEKIIEKLTNKSSAH